MCRASPCRASALKCVPFKITGFYVVAQFRLELVVSDLRPFIKQTYGITLIIGYHSIISTYILQYHQLHIISPKIPFLILMHLIIFLYNSAFPLLYLQGCLELKGAIKIKDSESIYEAWVLPKMALSYSYLTTCNHTGYWYFAWYCRIFSFYDFCHTLEVPQYIYQAIPTQFSMLSIIVVQTCWSTNSLKTLICTLNMTSNY